jgi:predicted alpha/beta superfamily hydrolase
MIPELIIVAIFHKDRNHDLTPTHITVDFQGIKGDEFIVSGGAEEFLQFIEKELIIQVEKSYCTAPYRILAGHSLGGLFAVYSYLVRGNLFNAYIAMDPALWWDNSYCEKTLKSLPGQSSNLENKLYISSSHLAPKNKRDKTIYRKTQNSFSKELNSKIKSKSKHDYFEKDNHYMVPIQSLYNGLSYVFNDYYLYNNRPFFKEDTSFVQNHFKHVSNIYGISPIPPEGLVERTGYVSYIFFKDYKKAIEFCKLNVNNYPNSSKAYENLAKAYKASGNKTDAISNFKKSLELNPENTEIQKILIELEGQ